MCDKARFFKPSLRGDEKEMRLTLGRRRTSDNLTVKFRLSFSSLISWLVYATLAVPEILCSLFALRISTAATSLPSLLPPPEARRSFAYLLSSLVGEQLDVNQIVARIR